MSLNISLIRESFEEVKPIADEVVSYFYKTLFDTYPASQSLFDKTDMEKQKKALIGSLVTIVDSIDSTEHLVPYLKKLGARHVKYGTKEEHYSMVGRSLITTFRHFFGNNWTTELEDQWVLAIGIIADQMLEGAREFEKAQASSRVFEINSSTQRNEPGQDLSIMAKQLARNLLFKLLEQEVDGEFMKQARKKVSNILTQALREEAELIQEQFSKKKAS